MILRDNEIQPIINKITQVYKIYRLFHSAPILENCFELVASMHIIDTSNANIQVKYKTSNLHRMSFYESLYDHETMRRFMAHVSTTIFEGATMYDENFACSLLKGIFNVEHFKLRRYKISLCALLFGKKHVCNKTAKIIIEKINDCIIFLDNIANIQETRISNNDELFGLYQKLCDMANSIKQYIDERFDKLDEFIDPE